MTMRISPFIATAIVLLLGSQALAGVELVAHTAEYKVRISVVSGRLDTSLRRTESGYIASHVIRPTGISRLLARGSMDVSSEFSEVSGVIKPDRYQAVDSIRDDPAVDLRFDWDSNEASGTVGNDAVVLQLDGMVYDNVSIQYALMHDLLNGGVADQYVLFDIDKMRVANVTDVGSREIETRAGTFTAVGIRHQKEGSSRITTMWCVEKLGYLPVIIEQHRKGKTIFRATLVEYTPTGA